MRFSNERTSKDFSYEKPANPIFRFKNFKKSLPQCIRMKRDFFILKNKKANETWVKNFYFNRTSVQKLLFLFSFLKNESFTSILSNKIVSYDFSLNQEAESCFLRIRSKLYTEVKSSNFSFGFVSVFESTVVYYFKNDFDFDEFFHHFSNIEKSENIIWKSLEFFDKTVKILEIFKKNSLIRVYRNEIITDKNSKVKKLQSYKIDLEKKESYFFIKKYEPTRMKLVLYFYKI